MARFVATHPGSRRLVSGLIEFGPLASLVSDPRVTDVFANGPNSVWADRGGGPARVPISLDELTLRHLAVRLVSLGGRHVDEASPCVDVRLFDGIRVHVVLPPISPTGTLLSIRLPSVTSIAVTDPQLISLVEARTNLLITGA